MSSTVLYMSMSLDGFITGPTEGHNGLGDGGERLHEWVFQGSGNHPKEAVGGLGGVNNEIVDEFMSTGAVIAGRGTFEPAEGWEATTTTAYPSTSPAATRHPAWAAEWPAVHFVSDLEAAVRDAKHAAGDKNVLVHGAGIAQRALTAGLLDELEIHLVPVLLGDGRRLFEHLGIEQRQLERIRVLKGEVGVTHLRYRVCR